MTLADRVAARLRVDLPGWEVSVTSGRCVARRRGVEIARRLPEDLVAAVREAEARDAGGPTLEQRAVPTWDLCGVCGQPAVRRVSSCSTVCGACGAKGDGCS